MCDDHFFLIPQDIRLVSREPELSWQNIACEMPYTFPNLKYLTNGTSISPERFFMHSLWFNGNKGVAHLLRDHEA
jgi:hypothetical protein